MLLKISIILSLLVGFSFITNTTFAQVSFLPSGNTTEEQQQAPASGWENYTDSTYNFKMIYPSDWELKTDLKPIPSVGYFPIVIFSTPDASLEIDTLNAHKVLNVDSLQLEDKSAHQYVTEFLQNKSSTTQQLKESGFDTDFKYIKDLPLTVGAKGDPAWRVDYMDSLFNHVYYNIDIYLVKNGHVFIFRFDSDPLKVPESLPTVEKMIRSFQFIS